MEKENKEESKIEETTTFDERRKVLVHKSTENKKNDLGDLVITTTATIHEKGIRQTISDLDKRKKNLIESIKSFEEVLIEAPKMTPELQEFKDKITALQLIQHKKSATEASKKKEADQLENCKKDLKTVEKDLRDIKQAIGSRLKI